jgi:membrane protease YdiL (CAAX protease family)
MWFRMPQTLRPVPFAALAPFLLLAFGIAWGLVALLVLFPDPITALFGPVSSANPLFILAVYAPAIAAIALVVTYTGLAGLGRFLSRLLLWRCPPGWYAFLILGIPAIYMAGAAIKGLPPTANFPAGGIAPALAALGFMLILGPVEEFGWRGLALPLLQRRMAPIWASLVLGFIWGLWHLPAFFLSGTPQNAWSFTPFFIGAISVSVILTPMFNRSGGSILLPALFHFQLNNPLWPDAQPYDTPLFAAAALIVIWLHRDTMFTRTGVTTVVPG